MKIRDHYLTLQSSYHVFCEPRFLVLNLLPQERNANLYERIAWAIAYVCCNFVLVSIEILEIMSDSVVYLPSASSTESCDTSYSSCREEIEVASTIQPYEGEPRASNEDFDED